MSTTNDTAKPLSATEAKTNFIRLSRLVMEGGTRVLQEVLDNIHPPAALPTILADPTIKPHLIKLQKTYQDILYPAPGNTSNYRILFNNIITFVVKLRAFIG